MKHRRKFQGDGHKAAEALYGPRNTDKNGQTHLDLQAPNAPEPPKKEKQ